MQIRSIIRNSAFALTALGASFVGHEANTDNLTNVVHTSPFRELTSKEIYRGFQVISANNHEGLIQFHGEKTVLENEKICKAYIPPSPEGKPLYILVLGHHEPLNFSAEYSAIQHFYERLVEEDKGIVLLFRTGLVLDELNSMADPETKQAYEPEDVLKSTKNITGDFIDRFNPCELRLSGFSWGGGTIKRLAEDNSWRKGTPVKSTVMIDPVNLGSLSFASAMRTRPEFDNSPHHRNFHIYQRRNDVPILEWVTTIQGNYPIKLIKSEEGKLTATKDERPQDLIWQVPDTSHLKIDELKEVRDKGYEFLTS